MRRVTDDEWKGSSASIYTEKCVSAESVTADSLDGKQFNLITGGAGSWKDVAIAPDGTIWAIDSSKFVWYYKGGVWT